MANNVVTYATVIEKPVYGNSLATGIEKAVYKISAVCDWSVQCRNVLLDGECIPECPFGYTPSTSISDCPYRVCESSVRDIVIIFFGTLSLVFIATTIILLPIVKRSKLFERGKKAVAMMSFRGEQENSQANNSPQCAYYMDCEVEEDGCTTGPNSLENRDLNEKSHKREPSTSSSGYHSDDHSLGSHDPQREIKKDIDEHLAKFRHYRREPGCAGKNYVTENFAAGMFGPEGGFLEIPSQNISMSIPAGSIIADDCDKPVELFMYVTFQDRHLPNMLGDKDICPVGPLIFCGTHGVAFSTPVVITAPSSAQKIDYKILMSNTDYSEMPKWENIDSNPDAHVTQVGDKMIYLVNHFTGLQAAAASLDGATVKEMKVGVFGPKLMTNDDMYQFWVKIWSKEQTQHILADMNSKGLKSLDQEDGQCIDIMNNNSNVVIDVKHVCQGWGMNENKKELPWKHVWTNHSQYCTFRADRLPSNGPPHQFVCQVDVYQNGCSKGSVSHCILDLHIKKEGVNECLSVHRVQPIHKHQHAAKVGACSPSPRQVLCSTTPELRPQANWGLTGLKPELCSELALLLDVEKDDRKDWHGLANLIGLDSTCIQWISQQKSHTTTVLNVLAAIEKEGTYAKLQVCMRKLGHEIAEELVSKYQCAEIVDGFDALSLVSGKRRHKVTRTPSNASSTSRESGYQSRPESAADPVVSADAVNSSPHGGARPKQPTWRDNQTLTD